MSWSFVSGQAFTGTTSLQVASYGLAITGVTVGDLLCVNVIANGAGATPVTVNDGHNTYVAITYDPATLSGSWFYTIVTTGGSLTITATPTVDAYLGIGVAEWRCSGTPAFVAASAPLSAYGESATTPSIAFSGGGNFLAVGMGDTNYAASPAISSPYNSRYAVTPSVGDLICGDQLNLLAASSPASATFSIASNEGIVGCVAVFLEVDPPIFLSPSAIPSHHSGDIVIALTGIGTDWTSGGTTFTVSGGGAVKAGQTVTSTTAATLTVTTGSSTGTCTVSDGTYSATLQVLTATLLFLPVAGRESATSAGILSGANTLWLSETPSTLFSLSGISGTTLSSVSVTSNTLASCTITSGSTAATGTVTDNSTTATASFQVVATAPPGFLASPNSISVNATNLAVTLTANGTAWNAGSPGTPVFTIIGSGGIIIESQTIASATLATLALTTGVATGACFVTDGNYLASIDVAGPAVGRAYVGRSSQLAYFATTSPILEYSGSPPVATFAVTATGVTSGGSGYTSPAAAVSGGIALTLVNGGSGYTSAPSVSLSGGGGSGASAVAAISSGIALVLTSGGSGYTSWPSVTVEGGSGTGASALASGGIALVLTSGGSGYPASVTVAISGGGGQMATAVATTSGGSVNSLTVTFPGYGYTSAPTVSFGGVGSGAVVSASLAGGVVGGFTATPGAGYTGGAVPTVTVAGGGGSGAAATAYIPPGAVSGFTVAPGSGYTSNPTVTISGGGGRDAVAAASVTSGGGTGCVLGTPQLASGAIAGIPVAVPGTGYTSAPTVAIGGATGTGAAATAVLGGGPAFITAVNANPTVSVNGNPVALALYLNSVPVVACGSGYSVAPSVTIAGGAGTNATAMSFLTIAGGIALTLTSGGAGYSYPPRVIIGGAPGSNPGATATAFTDAAGAVAGFTVTGTGAGYVSAPPVTFEGGGGAGAAATASYEGGSVYAILATNPGWGFLAGDVLTATVGAPGSGVTATAVTAIGPLWPNGGAIGGANGYLIPASYAYDFVPYQMLCGSVAEILVQKGGSGYTHPVATATGGSGGSGTVLGKPTLLSGVIATIPVTGGASASAGTVYVIDSSGTGSGFVGSFAIAADAGGHVLIESGGSNYTSGSLTLNVVYGVGSGAVLTVPTTGNGGLVNGVIGSVPVTTAGSAYTSNPTIALADSDGGTGTGAVAVAIMSGPAATDTVSYSAPAGWLTASWNLGGIAYTGPVPAANSVPMSNYAGQLEPNFAEVPRTMQLGMNNMSPFGQTSGRATNQNWLRQMQPWVAWNGLYINPQSNSNLLDAYPSSPFFTPIAANLTQGSTAVVLSLDPSSWAIPGQPYGIVNLYCWFPGDTSGGLYQFTGNTGVNAVISPAFGGTTLSGAPVWASPAAYIIISNGAGDSTGQLAVAQAVVNSSGEITGLTVLSGGTGYTAVPTVTVPIPPTGGTQATGWVATVVDGVVTAIAGGTGGSGYAGVTADGHPISINSPYAAAGPEDGHPHIFGGVAANSNGDSTDNQTLPDQTGVYTLVADENNRVSPMIVTLRLNFQGLRTYEIVSASITDGTISGNTETGKTWNFTVTRPTVDGQPVWPLEINLDIAGPVVATSAPYTLSNEYFTVPSRSTGLAIVPNRADPMAPDPNFAAWLAGAASVRCWPFGNFNWYNNVVDAEDLRPATDFNWNDGPQRNTYVTVTAVRAYQIWSGSAGYYSPYVYTNNNYPGTLPTAGNTPVLAAWGAGTAPAYYWVPPGNALENNLGWMGFGSGSQRFGVEFVTASPHGLKTGQTIAMPFAGSLTAVPVYDINAAAYVTANLANALLNVFITSATTFAALSYDQALTSGPLVCNVGSAGATSFPAVFNLVVPYPPGAPASPYEAFTGLVAAIPGCGLHTFVPAFATAACAAVIAQRIRDTLPLGRKLYLEVANEHWNYYGPNYQIMFTMAGLCAGNSSIRANISDDYYTWLAAFFHNIFVTVFNETDINGNTNRGDSIVRVFGGFINGSGATAGMVAYANAYNATSPAFLARIDAVMIAPYAATVLDINVVAMAASAYSNYPGSIQYGSTTPWPLGLYVDQFRHYMGSWGTYNGGIAGNSAALAPYELVPGQTTPPFLMCYEASVDEIVPAGPSLADWNVRPALAHDTYFHPFFTDVCDAFHATVQSGDVELATEFAICQNRYPGGSRLQVNGVTDNSGCVVWGCTDWGGMTWGRGDGTLDGNGGNTVNQFFNGTGRAQDLSNASPKLQSWQGWQALAGASLPSSPTVSGIAPATGVLAGGTSVTVTGSGFTGATGVAFGGNAAASFSFVGDTTVTAVSPAGSAGTVDVTVTTAGGTSATSSADQFVYANVPSVSGVSPSDGPVAGGTVAVLTGTFFTGATGVSFGETAATSFAVVNSTTLWAGSPAGSAGAVDVTVTTAAGTSVTSSADQFTYLSLPTVSGVSPSSGPVAGGTTVTITGTGLSTTEAVHFGASMASSFTVVNATTVTAQSPPTAAGVIDVTVSTAGGTSVTSSADHFTYTAGPVVTSIVPNYGPPAGGTTVTITGTGFTSATAVYFGSKAAASFTVVDATTVTATSAAGPAGAVDVVVITAAGGSAPSPQDRFVFNPVAGAPLAGTKRWFPGLRHFR